MDKVQVPVDLLLDSTLTASAKVVWIALRIYPEAIRNGRPSPTRLAALTGLSRPTVRKGLARLAEVGWLGSSPRHHDSFDQERGRSQNRQAAAPQRQGSPRTKDSSQPGPADSHGQAHTKPAQPVIKRFVTIPRELIEDRLVKPQAVVMYGVLQITPGFEHPEGQYTCRQLRELTGRALKTIRRATDVLVRRGWLVVDRKNHLCPFSFTMKNPVLEECLAELERVKWRIERAKFKGEAVMKAFCTLAVPSSDYVDNPRLGSIVNPFTGEILELDRLYPGRLALEFNGPQHYEETEFASAQEVLKQRVRDLIKAMICQDQGIPLVVIRPEDLTLKTMIEKLSPYLPIRDLRNSGPIIEYLERVAKGYRESIRRRQAHAAKRAPSAGK